MKRIFILSAVLSMSVFLVTGCDDDPSGPGVPPDLPNSLEDAVACFADGLARLDTLALAGLLPTDFVFYTGRHASDAGTDSLSREQLMLAFTNMSRGTLEDAPCRITSSRADVWQRGDWSVVADGSVLDGCSSCSYSVDIYIERDGCGYVPVRGQLRFYVQEFVLDGNPDASPHYLIRGISDHTWAKSSAVESDSFTELIAIYLPAGLPRARLSIDAERGTIESVFSLDAGASDCAGLGLPPEPYRWRIGADGDWSDWTCDSQLSLSLPDAGEYTITLDVRNTVGWTSRADVPLDVVAVWPLTPDELLDTFAYGHMELDFIFLLKLVSHEFEFGLQDHDVQVFGLPDGQFDYFTTLTAVQNLFVATGTPEWDPGSIEFDWLIDESSGAEREELDAQSSAFTCNMLMHVDFSASDDVWVSGEVDVVVSLRDTTLTDGSQYEYWVFESIDDRTGWSGNMHWGALLATYR